ncbi:MAG: YbjN domain-containing protein [Rhodothermales bacterium]|nr:YbjN domain-containing protein [Rhodothermales bacterium]
MSHAQPVKEHFEFLGYETEATQDNAFVARRNDRYVLIVHPFADGTVVETLFPPADAPGDRSEFLALVNRMNIELSLTKVFVLDDGGLGLRAVYVGEYERARFTRFVEAFDNDCARFSQKEDLTLYLK